MNVGKIGLATLVGFIVMFLSGWLIWGFGIEPLHKKYAIDYPGLILEMPRLEFIAISTVLTALLWSIIYNRWAGIKTFGTGAKAGILIAVLSGLSIDLMTHSSMNLSNNLALVMGSNVAANLVWGALSGGAIGWMLGRGGD